MPRKPRATNRKQMSEWAVLTVQVLTEMTLYELTHRKIHFVNKRRWIRKLSELLEKKL